MEVTAYEITDQESATYTIDGGQLSVTLTVDGEWEIRRHGEVADVICEDDVDSLMEQPTLEDALGVALDATGGDEELAEALILVLGQEGR